MFYWCQLTQGVLDKRLLSRLMSLDHIYRHPQVHRPLNWRTEIYAGRIANAAAAAVWMEKQMLSTWLVLSKWQPLVIDWFWWHSHPQSFYGPLSRTIPGLTSTRRSIHALAPFLLITILYQLHPSAMIHSIIPAQITCLSVFLHIDIGDRE